MSRSLSLKKNERSSPLTKVVAVAFAWFAWRRFSPGARRYLRIRSM